MASRLVAPSAHSLFHQVVHGCCPALMLSRMRVKSSFVTSSPGCLKTPLTEAGVDCGAEGAEDAGGGAEAAGGGAAPDADGAGVVTVPPGGLPRAGSPGLDDG